MVCTIGGCTCQYRVNDRLWIIRSMAYPQANQDLLFVLAKITHYHVLHQYKVQSLLRPTITYVVRRIHRLALPRMGSIPIESKLLCSASKQVQVNSVISWQSLLWLWFKTGTSWWWIVPLLLLHTRVSY